MNADGLRFDPEALPVIGVDHHLPAVAAAELPAPHCAGASAPPAWQPEIVAESASSSATARARRRCWCRSCCATGSTVLLTQRTDHLTDHPGQISFPGGRVEAGDADATATALREAQEEIGLGAAHVEVLGSLPTYTTGTGFIVTPVVALVRPGFALQPDPFEVAEVFEVPLAFLMDPAQPPPPRGRAGRRAARVPLDALARRRMARASRGATSSGARRRRCCATSIAFFSA